MPTTAALRGVSFGGIISRVLISLFTLLTRVAQAPGGLDLTLVSEHDGTLAVDLAELERQGLIKTTARPLPGTNSRELTATVTDLGRAALQASPGPSADSPS